MAIIKEIKNGATYLFEVTYVGIKDGKRKYKKKSLGRVDENGELIASKKKIGAKQ